MPRCRGELRQRNRADDRGIEQEYTRVAVFADDPRMHAAGVNRAQACDRIRQAQRLERGAGAHDRDVAVVPAPGEVFGQHVERVGDDERDAGERARLDRGRNRIHDGDVLLQDVEPAFPGLGVMSRGDDENVFAIDFVQRAAADLDLRQQRPGMHEVERETARGESVTVVDRHASREPAHDERGRGRDTNTSDAHDADRQPSHSRHSSEARDLPRRVGRVDTCSISRICR